MRLGGVNFILSATASPGPTVADSSDWCPFDHESQVPMGYLREEEGKYKVVVP